MLHAPRGGTTSASPAPFSSLGEHGRTAVQAHFTADRMGRDVEALLEEIVGRR